VSFRGYVAGSIFAAAEFRMLLGKIFTDGTLTWGEPSTLAYNANRNIFYSILGFATGLSSFLSYVSIESLVEKNMLTLLHVDNNNENHVAAFLPEGPLNTVASWFLCKHLESFTPPISELVAHATCDVGVYGELLARIILLCAALHSADPSLDAVRRFMLVPIPLERFFETLVGDSRVVAEFFAANPHLRRSRVAFSYFQPYISTIRNPYDAMMRCFINGSAAVLKRGADLMIPLILEDGRMSFLAVQVKLDRHLSNTAESFRPIHDGLGYPHMFGSKPPLNDNRTFASLILSLHNSESETSNVAFVLTRPGAPVLRHKKSRRDVNAMQDVQPPPETIQPPALVICGCSYSFSAKHKLLFEDLVYRTAPRVDPYPRLLPSKLASSRQFHRTRPREMLSLYLAMSD
jgi:hypothetical protein